MGNEIGEPSNPAVLSRYWARGLHGGRHAAATLMHLDGVPVAVIAPKADPASWRIQ